MKFWEFLACSICSYLRSYGQRKEVPSCAFRVCLSAPQILLPLGATLFPDLSYNWISSVTMVLIFPAFHPCNFSLPVCPLRLDHQNPAACATKRCLSYASSKEHCCCKHYYVSKFPGFGPSSCSCIDLNLIKRLLLPGWNKKEAAQSWHWILEKGLLSINGDSPRVLDSQL